MDLENRAIFHFDHTGNRVHASPSLRHNGIKSSSQEISLVERVATLVKSFFSAKKQGTQANFGGSDSSSNQSSIISGLSTVSAPTKEITEGTEVNIQDIEEQINNPQKPISDNQLKTSLKILTEKLKQTPEKDRKEFARNTFEERIKPLKNDQLISGSIRADFFVHLDDLFKKTEEENKHEIDYLEQFKIDRPRLRNPIFGQKVDTAEAMYRIKGKLQELFPETKPTETTDGSKTLFERTLKILTQNPLNLILILWEGKGGKADRDSVTQRLDAEKKIIEIKCNYNIYKNGSEGELQSDEILMVTMYVPLDPNQLAEFIIIRKANCPTNQEKFHEFFKIFQKS